MRVRVLRERTAHLKTLVRPDSSIVHVCFLFALCFLSFPLLFFLTPPFLFASAGLLAMSFCLRSKWASTFLIPCDFDSFSSKLPCDPPFFLHSVGVCLGYQLKNPFRWSHVYADLHSLFIWLLSFLNFCLNHPSPLRGLTLPSLSISYMFRFVCVITTKTPACFVILSAMICFGDLTREWHRHICVRVTVSGTTP